MSRPANAALGLGEPSYWRLPPQFLPLIIQIARWPLVAEALLHRYLTLPAGPYRLLRRATSKANGPGYA